MREGEPFHLTVSAHVDEPVLELDNVTLPDLSGFESLGDERRCSASARGSECVEILTLDATQAGRRTLGPVTLDAVDARNGRPSRFATNTVDVVVEGVSGMSAEARNLIAAVVAILVLGALWWRFGRRPKRVVPAPALVASPSLPPAPLPVVPAPDARLREFVDALEREPTRGRAAAVRDELRARAGAREDETLSDLVVRGAFAGLPGAFAALQAIERAVFCEDANVERYVREALPYLKP